MFIILVGMNVSTANCKNCETTLNGNFCSNCGQTAEVHRYSVSHISHEVFHSFTHTDKSALVFLQSILIRPGYVAQDLFLGKRKKYFNLFTFFLLCSTVYVVSAHSSHYYELLEPPAGQQRWPWFIKRAYSLMSENGKYLSFAFLPINAFLSWLFFRKPKYNYAEHLVYNTIIFSVVLIFMTVIMQLVRVDAAFAGRINQIIQLFIVLFASIGNKQLFANNWFVTVLKTITTRILQIIIIWLIAILIAIVKG